MERLAAFVEQKYVAFLTIVFISFLVYFQVYTFEFCYDDFYSVLPIHDVEKLSSILRYFTEPVMFLNKEAGTMDPLSYYRPIATSSLTIDFVLWGKENPGMFHVMNLLLHTANACIFFLICRCLVEKGTVSLAAAVLYLVFPLSTEIISIYHYRVDLITSFFILLTLLATLANSGKSWHWQVALLFLCAMLCKEVAIGLLVLVPLFRHFRYRCLKAQDLLIALGVPMLVYWPLRYNALGAFLHPKTKFVLDANLESFSSIDRLLYVLEGIWRKSMFMLFPYTIAPKVFLDLDFNRAFVILGFLLLAALIVASLFYLKNYRLECLLAATILIIWFPVSSILIPVPDFVSPRFFYYPSPWICLLILLLVLRIPGRLLKVVPIALLLLMWGSASFIQKNWYKNNLTKALGVLSFAPYDLDALIVAGSEHYDRENYGESARHLNNALVVMGVGRKRLEGDKALTVYRTLAEGYLNLQKMEKALFVLDSAIKDYPEKGELYYLSAIAYYKMGENEKAAGILKVAGQKAKDFDTFIEMFDRFKAGDKRKKASKEIGIL